jgi:hypothetical protein
MSTEDATILPPGAQGAGARPVNLQQCEPTMPQDVVAPTNGAGATGTTTSRVPVDMTKVRCLDLARAPEKRERPVPPFPGGLLPSSLMIVLGARRSGAWMFGFVVAIVVTILVLGTHFTVAGWDSRVLPLVVGALAGVVAGALVAYPPSRVRTSRATYPDQVDELHERVREAIDRLTCSKIDPECEGPVADTVGDLLCGVLDQVAQEGPHWLDGSGFLDCWSSLHEAEENLILIESITEVLAIADYDLLRLDGSMIATKDALSKKLSGAVDTLKKKPLDPDDEGFARRQVRTVRMAIDEHREQQWDQLVRSRNGLLTAGVMATGLAYLIVVLAVGFHAASFALGSALVFGLVGAVVSATYQIQSRSNAPSEVEDFGFTTVKFAVVPVLAGLASVLGIVFFAEFALAVSGQTLGGTFSSWHAIFDWRKNTNGFAIAVLLGFAPSLFFTVLQNKANDAMKGLQSSQPSGGGS